MSTPEERLTAVIEKTCTVARNILDERQMRHVCGAMALGYGFGGYTLVGSAAGLDARTVKAGSVEVQDGTYLAEAESMNGRVRREGAGRKKALSDKKAMTCLKGLMTANGKTLHWSGLTLNDISEEILARTDIVAKKDAVSKALEELGYRKLAGKGTTCPAGQDVMKDIDVRMTQFLQDGDPVVVCDTRPCKVEDVGECAVVELGNPVSPVIEGLRQWWCRVGRVNFPGSNRLMVVADSGWRSQLWTYGIKLLAKEFGLDVHVCHIPAALWWHVNHVRHRLSCTIAKSYVAVEIGLVSLTDDVIAHLMDVPLPECPNLAVNEVEIRHFRSDDAIYAVHVKKKIIL